MSVRRNSLLSPLIPLVALLAPAGLIGHAAIAPSNLDQAYEHKETRDLVVLVNDASDLIHAKGEAGFTELRATGSRWRHGDTYVFVLDRQGNMLVHPDPALEGMNVIDLKDVNGKPIIRGLINAATELPDKPEGWYHYQWPVPGELLPRWKSTYVRLVTAPSGMQYIVGAGMYNDRMERAFVVDEVNDAVDRIERNPDAAFALFHDAKGPYLVKDAYIFVIKPNGLEIVNPAFPNLEGTNLMDLKDTQGKYVIREMMTVVKTKGSGWVDYMWPKPGDSISTEKSTYVSKAKMGNDWVLVGCGVYLADAPKATTTATKMTAPELMAFVRDGATLLEQQGEKAYPEFRKKGSKWFHGDTYVFIWSMDGTRVLHAADPSKEGKNVSGAKDVLGRPYGRMLLEAANSPTGEGWVHYMYPLPGDIFPTWKSTFVKRVTYPDGKQYAIGSGVYNMQMDKAFIEDVVNRASAVVAHEGRAGFAKLRDKTGPFRFMDTYVFVLTPEGVEVVNPGQPNLEGMNTIDLKDVNGKDVTRQCIQEAMKNGSGWVEYYWYKPGDNIPMRKLTYVRKVQFGPDTYIVASGFYAND
jgi:signal transduction histidine kinase